MPDEKTGTNPKAPDAPSKPSAVEASTPNFVADIDKAVREVVAQNRYEVLAHRPEEHGEGHDYEVVHSYDLRHLVTGAEMTYKISEVEIRMASKEPLESVVRRGLIFTQNRKINAASAAKRGARPLPELVRIQQNSGTRG